MNGSENQFSLSSPKGGEGRGEEAGGFKFKTPRPSPLAACAGRGGKNDVVRHRFFQCVVALGGRSSGIFAACSLGFASGRASHCFLRRQRQRVRRLPDRKSTRLNSSHLGISYAV